MSRLWNVAESDNQLKKTNSSAIFYKPLLCVFIYLVINYLIYIYIMKKFKQYKRKGLSEMILLSDFDGVIESITVSEQDDLLPHEEFNLGYVARDPKNHDDKWYVSKKYFDDNMEQCIVE